MKQRLSKEQAEAAAEVLLSHEPRFGDSLLGRVAHYYSVRRVPLAMWNREGIGKMPETSGFVSPASPLWGVMHRHTPFE